MRQRTILGAVVAAALLIPPAQASAGAPNYDCVVGDGGRLAIDQYSEIVAASGFATGATIWGAADDIRQGGPSLDLVARFHGAAWTITIRGGGESLVITRPAGRLTGHCVFIPGNFALRSADRGGYALRARPAGAARRLLRIPAGTAVWERPDRVHEGDWFLVEATIARAGSLTLVDGWLRQRKPSVAR